ncbi:MAG: hypothetical protein JWM53_2947 [bacterium]|nr:hypothetical protein [bacterium]
MGGIRNVNHRIRTRRPLAERFFALVDKRGPYRRCDLGRCWLWLGHKRSKGYGVIESSNRKERAHRVSWQLAHGAITPGMCILHKCDFPPCVRPDHLREGTHQDNVADRHRRGRTPRGERHWRAKLTWAAVREIRAADPFNRHALAAKFGVRPKTITHVRNRHGWRERP